MAANKRRKRRTSIRTAAGVAQEKFLERMRALADDPHRVLPVCPDGEPKQIAKVRAGIDKIAAGKIGFLARRDKGIIGAVANSLPLADLEAVPRMLDTKIAGKRRFFVQRGQVVRSCMLGVQNHDDPRALLTAYRPMAKEHGMHFFAMPGLWCTGSTPQPPQAWLDALAAEVGADLTTVDGGWRLGGDGVSVRLGFRDGPAIDVDPRATKGHLVHQIIAARYAGPRQRHPVTIAVVLPDGTTKEPARDALASYRAGVLDERKLADGVMAAWRAEARDGGVRFVLGDEDFGSDQGAFLATIDAEPWEMDALRAVTAGGHVGRSRRAADIFESHQDRLHEALDLPDARAFVARHPNTAPRDIIRLGLDEAAARAREATLPRIEGGAETMAIDRIARQRRRDPSALRGLLQSTMDQVTRSHIGAFAIAAGEASLLSNWSDEDRAAAEVLSQAALQVLDAEGDAYAGAVEAFLRAAGSGDEIHTLD